LEENHRYLKDKVRNCSANLWRNWQKCCKKVERFKNTYTNWMEGYISLNLTRVEAKGEELKKPVGRPKMAFNVKGRRA